MKRPTSYSPGQGQQALAVSFYHYPASARGQARLNAIMSRHLESLVTAKIL